MGQINNVCTSRKYTYLPHPKTPPPPTSNKASHISLNFWVLLNPQLPRKFHSLLCGGWWGWIFFWTCTIIDSILQCVCSVNDHRRHQKIVGKNISVQYRPVCHFFILTMQHYSQLLQLKDWPWGDIQYSLCLQQTSLILDIHVIDNCHLSKQGISWPVPPDDIPSSSLKLIEFICLFEVDCCPGTDF